MKRALFVATSAVLVVLATACLPAPTPPPLYMAPVIGDIQVSPQPAQPGDVVTITVPVSDDQILSDTRLSPLTVPSGATLPGGPHCAASLNLVDDVQHGVVTVTCNVPTFASNGTWSLDLTIFDIPTNAYYAYSGATAHLTFDVTGGIDDQWSPQLVSYRTEPEVVRQDAPFTLVVRLRDATSVVALPGSRPEATLHKVFADNSVLACGQPQYAAVSSTETDVSLSCTPRNYGVPGRAEAGLHRGSIPVRDALGHEGSVEVLVDVWAA